MTLTMRSTTSTLVGSVAVAAVVIACGGAAGRAADPGQPRPPAPGCGMTLFSDPMCETTFDQGCCAQQQACMADASCRRIAECFTTCEARRATEGCNCFANCAPQGRETPGLAAFEHLSSCAKAIDYPADRRCKAGC
jgi:hypothetical protein